MRKALFSSSAFAALLLATSLAGAQAPDQNRDEPKAEKSDKAGPSKAQEKRGVNRNGQPEPKGAAGDQPAAKPSTGQAVSEPVRSGHERGERGEQKNEQKADQRKAAEENAKAGDDKHQSEKRNEPSRSNTERSQPDKSKSTAAPAQNEKGAATQEAQPKDTTSRHQEPNRPTAAQAPASTPRTNTATGVPEQPAPSTTTGQPNAATATVTQAPPQKKLEISETFSRTRLSPPVRNLDVSINIGTVVPPRVHFERLPREVWSIEPRYRDYDYFSTEEDIVIVEPSTHRVVDIIPRDPSRARAQITSSMSNGGSSLAQAAGALNCQIMRRDPASGQLTEMRPEQLRATSGSGSSPNQLVVSVQTSAGQMAAPVSLDAPAGQIVIATQGNGDCLITIEPQPRR